MVNKDSTIIRKFFKEKIGGKGDYLDIICKNY